MRADSPLRLRYAGSASTQHSPPAAYEPRGGSSPLIRIARPNGLDLCRLGGDGDCPEEPPFRLGLRAGGGDPPQSRQREIFGIAVLAEPGALVRERLLHVPVDVAQGLQ